jgi:hypothetical protein
VCGGDTDCPPFSLRTRQPFTVHKKIIAARSRFFKAVTAEPWGQYGHRHSIELVDDDPQTFSDYLQCIYRNYAPEVTNKTQLDSCINICLLADKLADKKTMDLVTDAMRNVDLDRTLFPEPHQIQGVWERSKLSSPLRRLMVDFTVLLAGEEGLPADFLAEMPRELLCEFVGRYEELMTGLWRDSVPRIFQ